MAAREKKAIRKSNLDIRVRVDSASATPPTTVIVGISASVESGGPLFSAGPAEVSWNMAGSTATPNSGLLANGSGTPVALDTSGGNYNFVLTATADNSYFSSGTATVDIAVQAAQLQMYESDGSTVLAHSTAVTSGGWVLENSNDYNYSLDSNNNLIPADQQSGSVEQAGPNATDPALIPIKLGAEANPTAGGYYEVQATGGLELWGADNHTDPITSTTQFDATVPTMLYVEGKALSVAQGDQWVTLYWSANGGESDGAVVDRVFYTVWQITGAQNVPGNGQYLYEADVPSAIPQGATWSAGGDGTVGATVLANQELNGVLVRWNSGPVVADLVYSLGNGFTGQWNVNVVEVAVGAGAVTAPSAPVTADSTSVPGTTELYVGGGAARINFADSATIQGPNGNWGAAFMDVGFIQNVDITVANATYLEPNGQTFNMIASAQGVSAVDCNPDSAEPWVWPPGSPALWSAPTPSYGWGGSYSNIDLSYYDSPVLAVPSEATVNSEGLTGTLYSARIEANFTSYIAVQTRDDENGSSLFYTQLAAAAWSIDYGVITGPNGTLVPYASQAITAPVATYAAPATAGALVPITTGQTANDLFPWAWIYD